MKGGKVKRKKKDSQTNKKNLCMFIWYGINRMDIYVIKTRFDFTTLPKVNEPREAPYWSPTVKAKQVCFVSLVLSYIFKGLEKFTQKYLFSNNENSFSLAQFINSKKSVLNTLYKL